MPRPPRIEAYPWASLDRVDRRAERMLHAARRRLERATRPERFSEALSGVVGADVRMAVARVRPADPNLALTRVGLALGLSGERCVVGFEPGLAAALLATLLRRSVPLVDVTLPLDAPVRGALSALIVEAARRSGAATALRPAPADVERDWVAVELDVLLDDRPYVAALFVSPALGDDGAAAPTLCGRLADVELSLPLVVAASLSTPRELAQLVPGAAWCPRGGAWIDRAGLGRGALCARASERGIGVELGPDSRIVLRDAAIVPLLATEAMAMNREQSTEPTTLSDAVLDAPLVVRVELGQVSMPARNWAALKPGDVLETGRRIGEPVSLSTGGRAIARGELVDVEGELGVRVTEVFNPERT